MDNSQNVPCNTAYRAGRRRRYRSGTSYFGYSDDEDSLSRTHTNDSNEDDALAMDYDVLDIPENNLEAQRMINNRKFGFRKWKGHVSERPLSARSAVVQSLYAESYQPVRSSTCTIGNMCYVVLFGWWVSLMYVLVCGLMYASYVGRRYGKYCLMMAKYFLWPFGKFIHWNSYTYMNLPVLNTTDDRESITLSHNDETEPIIRPSDVIKSYSASVSSLDDVSCDVHHATEKEQSSEHEETVKNISRKINLRSGEAIAWLILGVPLLGLTHVAAFLAAWIPVVFIPVAKINGRALMKFLLLPPDAIRVEDSGFGSTDSTSDIVLYVHQAVNVYYYKYTVDGMNVILVNMLSIVIIAVITGYADHNHSYVHQEAKFALAMISIIPLAYYIGMAITSISAQTLPAIGALLNATFGSIVEIILYTTSLLKEKEGKVCFAYLVKASLVGTLLATILLIPGLAMVIGGLKHSTQRFNSRSTAVSATLLFVSIAAVFAPSIFSTSYRSMNCSHCVNVTNAVKIGDKKANLTWSLDCSICRTEDMEEFATSDFYKNNVEPLAICCMTVLVIAYIVGLVFSLKTHKVHVYESFVPDVVGDASGSSGEGHAAPRWGRAKSIVILLVGTVIICVCADLVVMNIEPIIKNSGASINFIGVTMLAIVPDIPEIVIGIQFALQNSITMSIEVGCNIATQVCMVQIPVLVFLNLVHLVRFHLLFSEIHIWTVGLGVFMMNYTFQDGKSDYFQGSALVLAYTAFIFMYYFTPDPLTMQC